MSNLSKSSAVSPTLPRRAETFSGFDKDLKPKVKEIDFCDGGEREIAIESSTGPQPRLVTMDLEQQQQAAIQINLLNNLTCLVAEHFTSLER